MKSTHLLWPGLTAAALLLGASLRADVVKLKPVPSV